MSELNRLVGGLPASAKKYPAWWAEGADSHAYAKYWLDSRRLATPDFNATQRDFEAPPQLYVVDSEDI